MRTPFPRAGTLRIVTVLEMGEAASGDCGVCRWLDDIPTQPIPIPEEDDRLTILLAEFRDVMGKLSERVNDLLDGNRVV